MKDFVKLNNVCCGYGKSFNLSNINFSLSKGQFAGVVGPNGSGKSTLLKGLSGELKINPERAFLNNSDLSLISPKERAREIAIVSQFADIVDVTVEEYVLLGRLPYHQQFQFFETKRDFAIARKYMKLTDVYHLRNKVVSHLSGGEQQLAAIAKALTQEPEFLLLDEPTSHLDISHQVQILNLIQELSTELGITVLMVIHDLNLASEYCDYLVLMNEGKVFYKGTPQEVLNYKNIEDVYKTVVITQTNPLSNKPAIFLVSNKVLTNRNKISK